MSVGGTPHRLNGWKEIAAHLGRDVRTAIRWERERGLPVHRVPGGARGSVFAYVDEIDRWLLTSAEHRDQSETSVGVAAPQTASAPGGRRASTVRWMSRAFRWALGTGCVALLLGAIVLGADVLGWRRRAVPVAAISFRGTELEARDADRRILWRHDFGRRLLERVDPVRDRPPALFASGDDLDGDSRPDLVVSVPVLQGPPSPTTVAWDELFAFSAAGRVLWSHRVERTLRFGSGIYGPPWIAPAPQPQGASVVVFEVEGEKRIAWAQNHRTWWPSMLTVLDRQGREIALWVHSGVIFGVVATTGPDGPVLLAAGISNSRASSFLAVLDARRVEGAGPEEPGSPFECRNCESGTPLRYFTFQPSEQTLVFAPYNRAYDIRPDAGGVEVRTAEGSGDRPFPVEGVARFSPVLELEHVGWSSGWTAGHRELERAGKLDHPVERCPERDHPRVREWTASGGWRELHPEFVRTAAASR